MKTTKTVKKTVKAVKPVAKRLIGKVSFTCDDMPTRMPMNYMLKGPEYAGCMNTGVRPVIWKTGYLEYNTDGYRFIVGPELYVKEAAIAMLMHKVPGRTFKVSGRTVYFCKSYKAAKAMFKKHCDAITAFNDKTRAEYQEKVAKARKGDVGAAISALMDF